MTKVRFFALAALLMLSILLTACGNHVKIHFVNGGTRTMTASSAESLLRALEREFSDSGQEGYVYAWFTDESGTTALDAAGGLPGELWQTLSPKNVTVTLDARGGTLNETSCTAAYGAPYGELPVPVKEGFLFDGWYTARVGGSRADGGVCTTAENHTLYASWVPQTYYTVYLYSNYGDASPKTLSFPVSGQAALPECPFTRENCVFTGWNTLPDGTGTAFADQAVLDSLAQAGEAIPLYAMWSGSKVVVTLDAGEGAELGAESVELMYGDPLDSLPVPVREGWRFVGWAFDEEGSEPVGADATVDTAEPFTLYAIWSDAERTLLFDPNGGTGTMEPLDLGSEEPVTLPACTFSRDGYTFEGWALTKDGSASYSDESDFTPDGDGDVTLYAVWKTESSSQTDSGASSSSTSSGTVKVTFNPNGGYVTTSSKTLKSGGTYGTMPTATRSGNYAFAGWYTAYSGGTRVTSTSTVPSSNTTLYAHWTETSEESSSSSSSAGSTSSGSAGETSGSSSASDTSAYTYTISYNANGGSGTMASSSHVNGTSSPLTANTFTNDGHTFGGWSMQSDGTGPRFSDGESVSGLAVRDGDSITLYAIWK